MPNSPRKFRFVWVVFAAFIALILFVGNVAGNLIAADLDETLKPYRLLKWGVFFIALIVAIGVAVKEYRRVASSDHPNGSVDTNEQRSIQDKGKALKPDQIIHLYNAPVPTGSALHQLPTPPSDFTGRERELNELMRALEQGGVTISGPARLGRRGQDNASAEVSPAA